MMNLGTDSAFIDTELESLRENLGIESLVDLVELLMESGDEILALTLEKLEPELHATATELVRRLKEEHIQ